AVTRIEVLNDHDCRWKVVRKRRQNLTQRLQAPGGRRDRDHFERRALRHGQGRCFPLGESPRASGTSARFPRWPREATRAENSTAPRSRPRGVVRSVPETGKAYRRVTTRSARRTRREYASPGAVP